MSRRQAGRGLTRLSTSEIVGASETLSPPLRRSFVPGGPLGGDYLPVRGSVMHSPGLRGASQCPSPRLILYHA
jgi:hypothetical protein